MNNKGQAFGMMGAVLVTFILVIVGLALFNGGILGNIGATTNTIYNANETITFPSGTALAITGQAVTGDFIATNATDGTTITAANYTTANYQLVNGELTATIINASSEYAGDSVNLSYTYEPLGYATSSGARALIGLIAIFAALAIAVLALVPTFRSGVMNMFGR